MYELNYGNYNRKPPKKSKGIAGAAVTAVILVASILAGIFYFIYAGTVEKFNQASLEYQQMLEECNAKLSAQDENIDALENQLSALSSGQNSLSDSLLKVANDGSASIGDLKISDIAQKVSASVIGVRVTVPASSMNSFWYSQGTGSEGSGIILTADGYIATNFHVIEYVTQYKNTLIEVILTNGEIYTATYVGGDSINDLAVLKIDAKNLSPATLGSSSNSKVGDFVIAIGNPLGSELYGSVTFGIISGLNRKVATENVAEQLIQTDAAINPGNSGGALINAKGEIIGINTIKVSSTGVEGIGFAIPMEYAKPLLDSIIQFGYVKGRPTLGISYIDISRNEARIYGVPQGVYVTSVSDENKVLKKGDIITEADGKEVLTYSELNDIVKTKNVGDKIKLKVYNDSTKKTETLEMTVLELKS